MMPENDVSAAYKTQCVGLTIRIAPQNVIFHTHFFFGKVGSFLASFLYIHVFVVFLDQCCMIELCTMPDKQDTSMRKAYLN